MSKIVIYFHLDIIKYIELKKAISFLVARQKLYLAVINFYLRLIALDFLTDGLHTQQMKRKMQFLFTISILLINKVKNLLFI